MILTYHEVIEKDSRYLYSVTCSELDCHLALIKEIMRGNPKPLSRPVVTFDDGHRSNYDLALPLLQKNGISAIFFVTANWIGKGQGFMDWSQLREMQHLGHSIASHGVSHKLLTHCSSGELQDEVRRSKETIEEALGARVTSISMPGGRWNARVLEVCRNAGYEQLYHSDASRRVRRVSGIEVHGRFMIHRGTTAVALRPYLVESPFSLFTLRWRNDFKSACRSVLGDLLYARTWRVFAAKEHGNL